MVFLQLLVILHALTGVHKRLQHITIPVSLAKAATYEQREV